MIVDDLLKLWPLLTSLVTVALAFGAARWQSSRGVQLGAAAHRRLDRIERIQHAGEVKSAESFARLQMQVEELGRRHAETRDTFLSAIADLKETLSGRLRDLEGKVDSLVKDGCARRCA